MAVPVMPELDWPRDLRPSKMSHYLQPHVGGSESPFTRTRKTYGLSAPRWAMRMTFTASWRGGIGTAARGPRLEALIEQLEGGMTLARLFDFRRPYPVGLQRYYRQFAGETWTYGDGETFGLGEGFVLPDGAEPVNEPAPAGATSLVFSGFLPGETVFHAGDMIGGDGRIRLVLADAVADASGRATVTFKLPLAVALAAGAAVTMEPRGLYQLTNVEAGEAEADGRSAHATHVLNFVEWRP